MTKVYQHDVHRSGNSVIVTWRGVDLEDSASSDLNDDDHLVPLIPNCNIALVVENLTGTRATAVVGTSLSFLDKENSALFTAADITSEPRVATTDGADFAAVSSDALMGTHIRPHVVTEDTGTLTADIALVFIPRSLTAADIQTYLGMMTEDFVA